VFSVAVVGSEGGCVRRGVLKCLTDLWNWPLLHKLYLIVIALTTAFFLEAFVFLTFEKFVFGGTLIFFGLLFGLCFGLLCGFLLAIIFGSRISTRMVFWLPMISFLIAACVDVVLFVCDRFSLGWPVPFHWDSLACCFEVILCFVLGKKLGDGVNYILARFLHRGGV